MILDECLGCGTTCAASLAVAFPTYKSSLIDICDRSFQHDFDFSKECTTGRNRILFVSLVYPDRLVHACVPSANMHVRLDGHVYGHAYACECTCLHKTGGCLNSGNCVCHLDLS